MSDDQCCSCHLHAPCPFCEGLESEEEADIFWNGGIEALKAYRLSKEMEETGEVDPK